MASSNFLFFWSCRRAALNSFASYFMVHACTLNSAYISPPSYYDNLFIFLYILFSQILSQLYFISMFLIGYINLLFFNVN